MKLRAKPKVNDEYTGSLKAPSSSKVSFCLLSDYSGDEWMYKRYLGSKHNESNNSHCLVELYTREYYLKDYWINNTTKAAPIITIPIATTLRFWKYVAIILTNSTKTKPIPIPQQTPWLSII